MVETYRKSESEIYREGREKEKEGGIEEGPKTDIVQFKPDNCL